MEFHPPSCHRLLTAYHKIPSPSSYNENTRTSRGIFNRTKLKRFSALKRSFYILGKSKGNGKCHV